MDEKSKFQPVVPMLQAYINDYTQRTGVSVTALRKDTVLGGSSVMQSLMQFGKTRLETVEIFLEYFNLSYTELEAWYNAQK